MNETINSYDSASRFLNLNAPNSSVVVPMFNDGIKTVAPVITSPVEASVMRPMMLCAASNAVLSKKSPIRAIFEMVRFFILNIINWPPDLGYGYRHTILIRLEASDNFISECSKKIKEIKRVLAAGILNFPLLSANGN